MSNVDNEVEQDQGYEAVCPVRRPPCPWSSRGHATPEAAESRLREHLKEHETGIPAPELYVSGSRSMDLDEDEVANRHMDWEDAIQETIDRADDPDNPIFDDSERQLADPSHPNNDPNHPEYPPNLPENQPGYYHPEDEG